jgi:hypothetical protein
MSRTTSVMIVVSIAATVSTRLRLLVTAGLSTPPASIAFSRRLPSGP